MNFKDIVNDAPTHIKKEFIYRRHKKGNLIIHPHEQNNYLYILTTGIAEVYRQSYVGTMVSYIFMIHIVVLEKLKFLMKILKH